MKNVPTSIVIAVTLLAPAAGVEAVSMQWKTVGDPGNDKDVGKAGEKGEKHHFFYVENWESGDPGDPIGTHGRSDPAKHKPHPSVQVPEE